MAKVKAVSIEIQVVSDRVNDRMHTSERDFPFPPPPPPPPPPLPPLPPLTCSLPAMHTAGWARYSPIITALGGPLAYPLRLAN